MSHHATIYQGDVLDVLATLPPNSVHCVVTSPPYWGLRDYGEAGQIGLEETPEEYVAKMVEVFAAVRRVLRDDGSVWLNLGDSYAGTGKSGGGDQGERWENAGNSAHVGSRGGRWCSPPGNLKPGDLVGIPWRVAFALQSDGWYLRRDNIWAKPNPMPESVNGWRWEQCRVKVKARSPGADRGSTPPDSHHPGQVPHREGSFSAPTDGEWSDCPGCEKCEPNDGLVLRRGSWRCTTAHEYVFQLAKSADYFCDAEAVREQAADTSLDRYKYEFSGRCRGAIPPNDSRDLVANGKRTPTGRNPRSVWEITTKPYAEAHFATFPRELPERCIRAATAEKNCGDCGAPWAPVVERSSENCSNAAKAGTSIGGKGTATDEARADHDIRNGPTSTSRTTAHRPTCTCSADPVPATVLDPFSGAGTTGLVALRLNRNYIGIELNPEYVEMQAERIRSDAPLLYTVEVVCPSF